MDAGVKIAVENHAGDLHSTELARLVEAAGTDFVGVNFDSGNALWTLEDPVDALETLGKYTLTTSLRDSAVWPSDNGARVAWTAMGEGTIDQRAFFARFRELCPGAVAHIETISGFNRELPYLRAGLLEGVAGHAGAGVRALRGDCSPWPRRGAVAAAGGRRTGRRPSRRTSAASWSDRSSIAATSSSSGAGTKLALIAVRAVPWLTSLRQRGANRQRSAEISPLLLHVLVPSASIGSTRVARSAGSRVARSATSPSTAMTPAQVVGSLLEMPNS